MKVFLSCFGAVVALAGCASTSTNTSTSAPVQVAATETEYPTGSNIPRRKPAGQITSMSIEQAEEMRRSMEAQKAQTGK